MRIALVTYSTKPRGGVVHTLSLAEALARRGESVTVVSLGRGGDQAFFRHVDPAVTIKLIPFLEKLEESVGERIVRSIDVLAAGFDPSSFDVIHTQDCIGANAIANSIRTVHHIDHFETPELVRCHHRAIVEPRAHVCVSAPVAHELARDWGIKATVISNGVDSERFIRAAGNSQQATNARQAWRELIGGPYVLAVGGIEPRKATIDLVEAFPAIKRAWPEARLAVAGGETLFDYRAYRAAFDQRCAEVGVKPVVLGNVSHRDFPSLVAGATVFAAPSIKEGFGLAAMEAAAASVPLVVRDLPVFRSVLGDAATFAGDAAELAILITQAALNPNRIRLERGRILASGLSWDRAAREHQSLYAILANCTSS